jgi:hypothetical protein
MAAALAVPEDALQRRHGVAARVPAAPVAAVLPAAPALITRVQHAQHTQHAQDAQLVRQPRLVVKCDSGAWRAWRAMRVRVACAPEDGVTCTYVGPEWPARKLGASVLWRRKDVPYELWLHTAAVQTELRRIAASCPHVLWCPCAALKSCHAHALVALVHAHVNHELSNTAV